MEVILIYVCALMLLEAYKIWTICVCVILTIWFFLLTIKLKLRGGRLARFGTGWAVVGKFIVWIVILTKEIWTRNYGTVVHRVSRHRTGPLSITLRKVGHDLGLVRISVTSTKYETHKDNRQKYKKNLKKDIKFSRSNMKFEDISLYLMSAMRLKLLSSACSNSNFDKSTRTDLPS